ncbi:hypothetical protein B0H11DRAFT_2054516 [Mycena galericulata]|nr:hypothetical protein B0H11DRAFT_2054516 [Mycena galericulata]
MLMCAQMCSNVRYLKKHILTHLSIPEHADPEFSLGFIVCLPTRVLCLFENLCLLLIHLGPCLLATLAQSRIDLPAMRSVGSGSLVVGSGSLIGSSHPFSLPTFPMHSLPDGHSALGQFQIMLLSASGSASFGLPPRGYIGVLAGVQILWSWSISIPMRTGVRGKKTAGQGWGRGQEPGLPQTRLACQLVDFVHYIVHEYLS